MGYSVQQIAEDAQVNMSLSTVKRLKAKVREHGSIIREEGSGRPTKLLKIHQDFILKLLNNSPFNTCKKIVLKLKNKHGIEVDRTTISRFLVDKGFKWKGPQIVFRNNEQDQQNRLEFCLKNKDRNWEDVLITDEVSFYLWSPGKNRWVVTGDTYMLLPKTIPPPPGGGSLIKKQRQSIQIKFMQRDLVQGYYLRDGF